MTPAQMAVDFERASAEDVDAAVKRELEYAGVTLAELREQAAMSRFDNERCRLAWFTISPFV
jgi:hypothetical protein